MVYECNRILITMLQNSAKQDSRGPMLTKHRRRGDGFSTQNETFLGPSQCRNLFPSALHVCYKGFVFYFDFLTREMGGKE